MNPSALKSVYRYFEPADQFLKVAQLDASAFDGLPRAGLDRAGWRRAVVQACLSDWGAELEDHLARLDGDDPLRAEQALYELCVEVNPTLDLHCVRLPGEARSRERDATRAKPRKDDLAARVRGLRPRLARALIGQEAAVEAMARAARRAAAGLQAGERPRGALLFIGRTGTGKTEAARILARELHGERTEGKPLVRIDCSEYALAHEAARLVGAPPGYVGHEDGGQLTSELAKNPECVVLFDEIETAHPRLHPLMLQILEEGVLTDGKGRRASFARAFVVMTSNAGAAEMEAATRRMGFAATREAPRHAELSSIAHESLRKHFAPEFLGRIDETIVFEDLDEDAVARIAGKLLSELALRAREQGTKVAFSPAIARWVAARRPDAASGARALRRVIQRDIEAPLAELMVAGGMPRGSLLRARVDDGRLRFDCEP